MASPKDRGLGKNKRKWKEEEDDALIEVLKDLVNGGTSFKNHPRVNDWRGKPCPYYEDLCIIFGKDHASRKDAQGPEEMEDEVNEKGENEESKVASILGREMRAANSNINRAIGFKVELSEKCSKLNEELANLGLTTMEKHRAARKIASEPESVDVFFSILDAERKEWVQALLRGDI
ncbi:hypothetical protein Cgig2_029989 [Carnegiea gigantea]|uniref:Uncharacterized protein n=1 Tax=Carnegiea gigantea TaxID=171969 RepID=A0A9Q1K727_9CARY|nr:hypothetical protein Cgig2_029989 [Carnegiea gigantea]